MPKDTDVLSHEHFTLPPTSYQKSDYCSHIWIGAALFTSHHSVQKQLRGLVDDDLFPTGNIASLSVLYDECSEELYSLEPPILTFTAEVYHVTYSY